MHCKRWSRSLRCCLESKMHCKRWSRSLRCCLESKMHCKRWSRSLRCCLESKMHCKRWSRSLRYSTLHRGKGDGWLKGRVVERLMALVVGWYPDGPLRYKINNGHFSLQRKRSLACLVTQSWEGVRDVMSQRKSSEKDT